MMSCTCSQMREYKAAVMVLEPTHSEPNLWTSRRSETQQLGDAALLLERRARKHIPCSLHALRGIAQTRMYKVTSLHGL